jgi:protein O-GlcNAc transferase
MTQSESRQVPISEAMRLAIDHHQAGRLAEAEAIYRAILASEPTHAGANYNLGLIALQTGRPRDAADTLGKALQREPANPAHWLNYAVALSAGGDAVGAREVLLEARRRGFAGEALTRMLAQVERMAGGPQPATIETLAAAEPPAQRPPEIDALVELYRQQQYGAVEAQARQLAGRHPSSAQLAWLLGSSLMEQGKLEPAREVLAGAAAELPGDSLLPYLLGRVLQQLERHAEARAAFEHSLAIDGGRVEAWLSAAASAVALRDWAGADRLARQGLERQPNSVAALRLLAAVAAAGNRRADAVQLYRRAVALDPGSAELALELGDALTALGRPDEAMPELERASAAWPDNAQAHLGLGRALLRLGETAAAVDHFRAATELAPASDEARTAYLFCLPYDDSVTPAQSFAEHLRLGERIEAPWRPLQRPHDTDRDPERALRIGFVSGDLREHAVAYLIEPVWQAMRSGRHEIAAYANQAGEDAVSERLKPLAHAWTRIGGLDDEALAERIRGDRIDILVDLSGHTNGNRLPVFAMKPAPVQASWLGHPDTTGLHAIDYRLVHGAGPELAGVDAFFCEKLVRLRHRGLRLDENAPSVNRLPALGSGRLTFGSFGRPAKIGAATVALWSRVLAVLPDARLLVGSIDGERTRQRLQALFTAHGVAPERLQFRPTVPMATYLELHHEIDIALDTLPFAGETTTHHALWMGVPVLTRLGGTLHQNQGGALLAALGLADWAAASDDAYAARAVAAAARLQDLDALRQGLRASMTRTFVESGADVGRELDAVFQAMWRRWCAGLPAESFVSAG